MHTKTYVIKGIRPVLLHNGQTADPLNPYAIKLAELHKIKPKTAEIHRQSSDLEWESAVYWSEDDPRTGKKGKGLYMPASNLRAAFIEGAKKKRNGKLLSSGTIMADYGFTFNLPEGCPDPFDFEALKASDLMRLRSIGTINRTSKVPITRVIIPTGWILNVKVIFDEEVVNEPTLDQAVEDCGYFCGIGTFRRDYGRFIIDESTKKALPISKDLASAA